MNSDRFLKLLLSDSPRWLGEASYHLTEARQWVSLGRDLAEKESPLVRFYRCLHAFKGACSLMASRLPVAGRVGHILHEMEGKLALRDSWKAAPSWLAGFEASLLEIQRNIAEASLRHEPATDEDLRDDGDAEAELPLPAHPQSVAASSGGRKLVFPWQSVVEFIPGAQVQGRPLLMVGGQLAAVVPATGPAHDDVLFGIAVRTQAGRCIVVPVQSLELVDAAETRTLEPSLDKSKAA